MTLKRHERDAITALYQRHGSLRKVARMLGYSPNTVKKYVQPHYEVQEQNIVRSLKSDDQRLVGTYVGLWMGDGTQYMDDGSYVVKVCLDKRNTALTEFVEWVFSSLFGCSSCGLCNPGTNSYYVKVSSKFVFEFVNRYCSFSDYKTASVRLREPVDACPREFLAGCLLGLMLSDGHLDRHARFNVTSAGLAQNMVDILERFGFSPSTYVQVRDTPNWNDLIQVTLRKDETKRLDSFLDRVLDRLSYQGTFKELKYGYDPARI